MFGYGEMRCSKLCRVKVCCFFFVIVFVIYYLKPHSKKVEVSRTLTVQKQAPLHHMEEFRTRGYVIPCAISQQLGSAMYDLHQLADLAESWGFKVGEPKIVGSSYVSAMSQKSRCTFGDIFNLGNFNFNLRKDFKINYDLIIPAQNILTDRHLGPDITFIHWTLEGNISKEECFKEAFLTIRNCFKDTPLRMREDAMIDKVVCLKKQEKINFRSLLHKYPINQISEQNEKRENAFMVFFSYWTGIRTSLAKNFFFDPEFHERNYSYVHTTPYSQEVKMVTKEFKQTLNLKPVFIAIQIRLEKLIIHKKKLMSDINHCIDMLEFHIKKAKKRLSDSSFVAFTDYKPMGSSTCHKVSCASIAEILAIDKRLRSLGVIVNPALETSSSSPFTQVSGFMASVEQELMSQADFLIMTGAGAYQNGIIERYMNYHKMTPSSAREKVVRICHEVDNRTRRYGIQL